jgi:two-component system, chemotaxis family, chemotaxis protein CheY
VRLRRRPGPQVLLVDDSTAMRRLLLRALRHCGVDDQQVLEAPDAATALRLLDTTSPGLVLADEHLPDLPAAQLLDGVRRGRSGAAGALVCADRSADALTTAAAAGVGMLLPKPFSHEDVARALQGTLDGPAALLAAAPPRAEGVTLPSATQVEQLLSALLSREVTAERGHPVVPGPGRPGLVVAYVTRRLETAAVLVADLPLALALCAALELEPEEVLAASARRPTLSASSADPLRELAEVAVGLFVPPGGARLRLFALHLPGESPDRPTAVAAGALRRRTDLAVDVGLYGSGCLSLVVPA